MLNDANNSNSIIFKMIEHIYSILMSLNKLGQDVSIFVQIFEIEYVILLYIFK